MKKFLSALFVLFSVTSVFATTFTVGNSGTAFSPDSITIVQGDTVVFSLASPHNAQEVDSLTWVNNGNSPVTGFNTPFGGGIVTGLSTGTHYYVCNPHASFGMKGRIVVQAAQTPPSVQFVITSSTVNEGVGTFNLALSIANPNANPTSVDINVVAGGTATSGADYSYAPLTVTFPANSAFTQSITVTIVDDQLLEVNENFTLQLAFPTNNATIGVNAQHTVTIIDNDSLKIGILSHSLSQFENIGQVNIPVQLTHTSPNPTSVTVHLVPTGTTATQGSDFLFSDTTITWAANSSGTIIVPVNVIDDALFEPTETARFQLINPTNGALLLNDTFLLVIQNNDQQTWVDCGDLFFSEYIHGGILVDDQALEIYNPTSSPVNLSDYSILISTNGGVSTALLGLSGILAPNDVYVAVNNGAVPKLTSVADTLSPKIKFDGNDGIALLHLTDTIDIIGQLWVNPGIAWPVDTGSTYFHTLIRRPYTYHGGTDWWNTTVYTWRNHPTSLYDSLGFHHMAPCGSAPPTATIRFISSGVSVPESIGAVPVIVEVNNPFSTPVSFVFAHNNAASSATYNADYSFPIAITFTNYGGISYDTFYVNVVDDQLLESTETAVVYLTNLTGNGKFVADSVFNLSITDNDVLTISFNGAAFSYVEDTALVQVKITLSGKVADTTSALISLAPGSATRGVDFTFNDTTIVFPPFNMDTQSIWVRIINDTLIEPNEQINFNMSNVTNGAVTAITSYTLTIIDDDTPNGIDETDLANGIKMYPNPVVNSLFIETESELTDVEVTDLLGNVIMKLNTMPTGKHAINVSALSAGMYFVNVRNAEKVLGKRFVKQD